MKILFKLFLVTKNSQKPSKTFQSAINNCQTTWAKSSTHMSNVQNEITKGFLDVHNQKKKKLEKHVRLSQKCFRSKIYDVMKGIEIYGLLFLIQKHLK